MKELHKLNFAIAVYQGIYNFNCPNCGYDFMDDTYKENVIGYDELINGRYVLIFECPTCFLKSYCHVDKENINTIKNLWEQL